mmetsp:Transcript_30772/g.86787  ORF Transcript_30772/g.86787 Transcript_30772/m.86787 type:complete len:318 (+) Transcript_30772:405-1358(+)
MQAVLAVVQVHPSVSLRVLPHDRPQPLGEKDGVGVDLHGPAIVRVPAVTGHLIPDRYEDAGVHGRVEFAPHLALEIYVYDGGIDSLDNLDRLVAVNLVPVACEDAHLFLVLEIQQGLLVASREHEGEAKERIRGIRCRSCGCLGGWERSNCGGCHSGGFRCGRRGRRGHCGRPLCGGCRRYGCSSCTGCADCAGRRSSRHSPGRSVEDDRRIGASQRIWSSCSARGIQANPPSSAPHHLAGQLRHNSMPHVLSRHLDEVKLLQKANVREARDPSLLPPRPSPALCVRRAFTPACLFTCDVVQLIKRPPCEVFDILLR